MQSWCLLVLSAVCVFTAVQTQPPPRCSTPNAWEGHILEINSSKPYERYTKLVYDLIGERMRMTDELVYKNEPYREYYDEFYFYKEKRGYRFNLKTNDCEKMVISDSVLYIHIPQIANYTTSLVMGSKGGPGLGLNVDLWVGNTDQGRYLGLWTRDECMLVYDTFHFKDGHVFSWYVYDVVLGFNPAAFVLPDECR